MLLLAIPSDIGRVRLRVLDLISGQPITVKTIPSIKDMISGAAAVDEFKDLNIEDLLGRQTVQPMPS